MMLASFSEDELRRLLARPVRTTLGPAHRRAFAGRRVLITGAGGSIGSELARQVASCAPGALALLDQSELGLFAIERELRADFPELTLTAHLADVTRRAPMQQACRQVRPHVVYHAAAYKHVTMAERAPSAAAQVNVVGTAEVALAARAFGARFVLISSDKAADPRSVMGATKRLAEVVTLSMASPRFRPVVVRFGNVIGSSGSVVQIMRACVRAGRPIPMTDPEATRYFMTAGEAAALVMRADLLDHSAEIYWLDMGEPVRMGDLAARVMALEEDAGFLPVPVEVIGLRPGEKRTETLTDRHLVFERTVDRQIRAAREGRRTPAPVAQALTRLRRACDRADDHQVIELLSTSVAGFSPSTEARTTAAAQRAFVPTERRARPRRRRAA